jgi:hypothetical protein
MHVVVDNSAGGDPRFAEEVARGLRAHGFVVELRRPSPESMFDTAVHFVSTGLIIRVPERPDRTVLTALREVVRSALLQRPSRRRRSRAVPIHLSETSHVIEWIDPFD